MASRLARPVLFASLSLFVAAWAGACAKGGSNVEAAVGGVGGGETSSDATSSSNNSTGSSGTSTATAGGGGGSTSTTTVGSTTTGTTTVATGTGGAGGSSGNCDPGEIECNGVCVDPMSNLSHCGGCNLPCVFGEACCSGECADFTNDSKHCGSCDNACGPLDQCLGSQCQPKDMCCGDNQNDQAPLNSCFQGAQWITWDWTPSCDFNITRIEIHSDQGNVALLADANNFPGALMFQGPLGPPDPMGWIGSDVVPPVAVLGGQKYWLAENVGLCSISAGGQAPTYYGSFGGLGGPWEGPFSGDFWTAHIIGECVPP